MPSPPPAHAGFEPCHCTLSVALEGQDISSAAAIAGSTLIRVSASFLTSERPIGLGERARRDEASACPESRSHCITDPPGRNLIASGSFQKQRGLRGALCVLGIMNRDGCLDGVSLGRDPPGRAFCRVQWHVHEWHVAAAGPHARLFTRLFSV